jgi:hypothetical protein
MSDACYRGTVRGGTVILEADVNLPDGTGVLVTPVEMPRGSSQAILAAAKAPPHLKHEDVEEFLKLIEGGKRPVRYDNPLTRGRRKGRREGER